MPNGMPAIAQADRKMRCTRPIGTTSGLSVQIEILDDMQSVSIPHEICLKYRHFILERNGQWPCQGPSYLLAHYLTDVERSSYSSVGALINDATSFMRTLTFNWTRNVAFTQTLTYNMTKDGASTFKRDLDAPLFPDSAQSFAIPLLFSYPLINPVVVITRMTNRITIDEFAAIVLKVYTAIFRAEGDSLPRDLARLAADGYISRGVFGLWEPRNCKLYLDRVGSNKATRAIVLKVDTQ